MLTPDSLFPTIISCHHVMFFTLSLPNTDTQPIPLRRRRISTPTAPPLNAPSRVVPLPRLRRRRRRHHLHLNLLHRPRQRRRDRDIPGLIGETRVLDDSDLRCDPHNHARSLSPVRRVFRGWSFGLVRVRAGGGVRVRGEGDRGFALVLDRKCFLFPPGIHPPKVFVVVIGCLIRNIWSSEGLLRLVFTSSNSAKEWAQGNKYFHVLSKGVKHDGWKFVLLARFSPIPSYVINYALAMTEVSYFVDFLLPTVIGCLPMILQNTSLGSLANAAVTSASGSKKSYVLPLLGVTSSILISLKIRKYSKNIVDDDENIHNPRKDSDSSAVLE
ncbi:TVP38/TMEM64 family membrane protein slr0305-like protein [Drosera capensis]